MGLRIFYGFGIGILPPKNGQSNGKTRNITWKPGICIEKFHLHSSIGLRGVNAAALLKGLESRGQPCITLIHTFRPLFTSRLLGKSESLRDTNLCMFCSSTKIQRFVFIWFHPYLIFICLKLSEYLHPLVPLLRTKPCGVSRRSHRKSPRESGPSYIRSRKPSP